MQNIIIKTSVENENCILHLLKENSLEAKVFNEGKTALFVLELCGYQVNVVMQIVHRFLKHHQEMLEGENRINVYICNEILFFSQDNE